MLVLILSRLLLRLPLFRRNYTAAVIDAAGTNCHHPSQPYSIAPMAVPLLPAAAASPILRHHFIFYVLLLHFLISQRQHTTNNNAMAAPMPFSANNSTSNCINQP